MKEIIKKIISTFTGKKKNDNLVTIGRYDYDSPEVRIGDAKLTITLGQWMGILPDSLRSGDGSMFVISHLDADELIRRNLISKEDYAKAIRKFSKLLSMVGVGADNTCILDSFDDQKLTFKCNFFETGEIAKMRIRFGSWIDECPAFIIDFDGVTSTFDYFHETNSKPDRLTLSHVVKDLDKDGNKKFYHYVSEFRYIGHVYDDNEKVEVEIQYPSSLEYGFTENPYVNTELLEEIISSVNFPLDIESLVTKITSALRQDVKDYPTIYVIGKKLSNDKNEEDIVLNEAVFKNGKFDKLTITKNDKTISIDQFDAWTYTSPVCKVSQNANDEWNCAYTNMPLTQFVTMSTPRELIARVTPEVEEVKYLAKTMLKK